MSRWEEDEEGGALLLFEDELLEEDLDDDFEELGQAEFPSEGSNAKTISWK
jgi:hypothetical protein